MNIQQAPPNKFGVFQVISEGESLTDEDILRVINGPIAAMEPKLQEELSKVVEF